MPSKDKIRRQKEREEEKEKLEQEKLLDEYWNEGTNKKAEKKAKLDHEKQMEKLQKQKEKKELEEADNIMFENSTAKIKKPKKKKGDDLDLLNQALKNAPKTKHQREIEKKEKEREYQKQQEEILKIKKKEREELQEKERQENIQKGLSYNHNDIMDIQINNTLNDDEECITGIDNILDSFSDNNTVTYDEFYNEKLEALKKAFPGLRLSQYKEKIFQLWKKSPYYIK